MENKELIREVAENSIHNGFNLQTIIDRIGEDIVDILENDSIEFNTEIDEFIDEVFDEYEFTVEFSKNK